MAKGDSDAENIIYSWKSQFLEGALMSFFVNNFLDSKITKKVQICLN